MAQGVVHGVPVRHGEKQKEEEGEVEQEVERDKEEEKSNNNAYVHGWDGMKRHCEALSQCESVNTTDDTSTNGAQCAQCCTVNSSVCVVLFTQLFTVVSM